jgi:hypothetical protein
MKNLYLTLALLVTAIFVQGQVYLYQGFGSGYWPPEGWTPLPLGSHWSLSPTDNAGGVLPEARFEGFDYTGTARLISPYIDMTGADTAILSFRYYPEIGRTDAPVFGVEKRHSGSNTWNNVWQTTLINLDDPREFEVLFTGEDLGNPDFQFSFYLTGNMNQLLNFYLDNVKLYFPTTADGKLDAILIPSQVELPVPIVAKIINLGNTVIQQVGVSFLTNMGIQHDSVITGLDLGLYENFTFQFDRWWVSPYGDYDLKAWISSVNGQEDPYNPNDTLVKTIKYQRFRPMRMPCFEEFFTADFADSHYFDIIFHEWCENHPYETAINYALNYNGYIDLYAIPDNEIRKTYYGIEYIPLTLCNGSLAAYIDTNDIQLAYDTAVLLTSPYEILSTYTLIGDSITITNNIFPHESIAGTSVHTIVTEKTTTGNIGGSGLESYYNIVMKMFPDGGYGEQVDFANGIPFTQHFSADLGNTNIEEFDDLAVTVFVQLDSNKEILQSACAIKDAVYNTENRLSMITLDGVPLEGFDPGIYYYDVALPQGSVEPPVTLGIPMYDSAFVLISQAFEIPGFAVIDVYPESLGSFKRYIVSFNFETNINNPEIQTISIYPNPTVYGKLFISSTDISSVKLFSLDGKLIVNIEKLNGNTIDLSGVKSGVYILNMTNAEGLVLRRKIVVL